MGLIRDIFGAIETQRTDEYISRDPGFGTDSSGSNLDRLYSSSTGGQIVNEDTAFNSSPFVGAIRLIANNGAKLPINIIDRNDKQVVDYDVAWQRKMPCKGLTLFQWKRMALCSLAIRGCAFLRIDMFNRGYPDLIRPLPSRYIYTQPRIGRKQSRNEDGITVYYNPSSRRDAANEEVLKEWLYPGHDGNCIVLRFDDDGELEGRNPIISSSSILGVALAAQDNANILFETGGTPAGMVGMTDASPAEVEQARTNYIRTRSIKQARHIPPFTSRAVSWISMHMTSMEQQLIEARQFSVQEIARMYNIPLQLLGDPNTTWGTGVHEMTKVLHNYAIEPYTKCFGDMLGITLPRRYLAEFDASEELYGDPRTQVELLTKAAGGPYMQINEARSRARLDRVEGGDVIRTKGEYITDDPEGSQKEDKEKDKETRKKAKDRVKE